MTATKLLADRLHLPDNDKREYRQIELANGLAVLLISDPSIEGSNQTSVRTSCWPWRRRRAADAANGTLEDEDEAPRGTKKAAFALAVGVGYLSDPPELQGCAHYVEHMLFMGTKKFPKENGWSTFLSRHGGVDNGETFAESTVFYFDLVPEQLQAGLERFGSFFSSPLFKWGSSAREARQIDSEFEQAAQDDACREDQLLVHLTTPLHPLHRFGWGNKKSLVDDPKRAQVDARSQLIRFHSLYYSANRMTACVIGREGLDTLQSWVESSFGDVPSHIVVPPTHDSAWTALPPPMEPHSLPLLIHVKPLEQSRSISMQWYLPPQQSVPHMRCKPSDLVGHLLGHEGAGSLLSHLKRRGLATGLSAGLDDGDSTSLHALFRLSIDLAPEGVAAIDTIVCAVFSAIGLLHATGGVALRWLWDELRDVAALCFRTLASARTWRANLERCTLHPLATMTHATRRANLERCTLHPLATMTPVTTSRPRSLA